MPLIGKHLPGGLPPREVQAGCAYCGFQYHRSKLRREVDSRNLVCDRCGTGRDVVLLSKLNAKAAKKNPTRGRAQAENYQQADNTTEGIHITSGEGYS